LLGGGDRALGLDLRELTRPWTTVGRIRRTRRHRRHGTQTQRPEAQHNEKDSFHPPLLIFRSTPHVGRQYQLTWTDIWLKPTDKPSRTAIVRLDSAPFGSSPPRNCVV